MSYRLLTIVVLLLAAAAGCCHPCCPQRCGPACAPMRASPPAYQCGPHCGPHGGFQGHLHDRFGHLHSLFKPPRPAEITPPVPRFHPVPARPVFEYPPAEYAPVPTQLQR